MSITLDYKKYSLNFKFEAGTSRGILRQKDTWILKISDKDNPKLAGYGEISTIDRLSYDYQLEFEKELESLAIQLDNCALPSHEEGVFTLVRELVSEQKPSIRFGLETALLDLLHGSRFKIFDNDFYNQNAPIPINGLIWMGDEAFMLNQIKEKIKQGFKCIKMKIGAIDFDTELKILERIRSEYSKDEITLRVDANGAFRTEHVLQKLDALSAFDLHSIEQPIMPRQFHAMQLVCKKSPIPVALDEELIGVFDIQEKRELLTGTRPQYIILKPSLLGGFRATSEWITLAKELNIEWWITSALESNVGLNAICQYTAQFSNLSYQGLGTGQLYENNIHSPLTIEKDSIYYHPKLSWDISSLEL